MTKITIGNTCSPSNNDRYYTWKMFVKSASGEDLGKLIKQVEYVLHPTFTNPKVVVTKAPFYLRRRGWGTFPVGVNISGYNGQIFNFTHDLSFEREGSAA